MKIRKLTAVLAASFIAGAGFIGANIPTPNASAATCGNNVAWCAYQNINAGGDMRTGAKSVCGFIPNLGSITFNDKISSIKTTQSFRWVEFREHVNRGGSFLYTDVKGIYFSNIGSKFNDKFSSVYWLG